MTCPSSWETASPKWACAGVILRQRERLTGQVSVSTTGLPALLDASLSSPWSQWFAGATNCMDLSAHLCLRNRYIQLYFIKTEHPNTHMLHAYSLCHFCLSTSVQSETQQSSWWWIWWSFQEHMMPPSTESDAIAGKPHNKTWNITTAATLIHLFTVAVQY